MLTREFRASLACLCLLSVSATAQSNADPGTDVALSFLDFMARVGRSGFYPNGEMALTFSTTVCNVGTTEVPWKRPMDPDHPLIAFLVVRESDGRMVQISDRSYVKHGFFALTSEECGPCTPPGGTAGEFLGLGCSDTYGLSNNSDRLYLGPPDEIDPWLGAWDPICSHFDRGEPAVDAPLDCDGIRSLTLSHVSGMSSTQHRVLIRDTELIEPGNLYYQGQYVVAREPEANRGDNLASRPFSATWNGSSWTVSPQGSLQHGTVLERWTGASVTSNTNGADDGRVYVARRISGPVDGLYRYEYAFHNRDNARGIDEIRLPICPSARFLSIGFHDNDADASNDWSVQVEGSELVLRDDSGENPLRWNSIYNLWFHSDAAPAAGDMALRAALPGVGAPSFAVPTETPQLLYNVYAGPGCAAGATPPLYATGTPPRALLGNATFGVATSGHVPGEQNWLFFGTQPGSISVGVCTLWMGGALGIDAVNVAITTTGPDGVAHYPIPVPNDPALEGMSVQCQAVGRNPAGGATFGVFEFSDALQLRGGNRTGDCP